MPIPKPPAREYRYGFIDVTPPSVYTNSAVNICCWTQGRQKKVSRTICEAPLGRHRMVPNHFQKCTFASKPQVPLSTFYGTVWKSAQRKLIRKPPPPGSAKADPRGGGGYPPAGPRKPSSLAVHDLLLGLGPSRLRFRGLAAVPCNSNFFLNWLKTRQNPFGRAWALPASFSRFGRRAWQ